MKSSELKRLLRRNGCFLVRQGTSHEIWESTITNERFSVPRHDSQEIRTGTLEFRFRMTENFFKKHTMYKITAIIEKGPDGRYAITSPQSFGRNHFGGFGDTIEEAKADFRECVEDCRELAIADGDGAPEEYQVSFRYDMPSFFEDFDFINASRFAQFAGINESKMRQYKSGVAFPGEKTTRKILDAIHRIGSELSSVSL